ncbi:MAG: transcriptional regulator [Bacteroidetes bacterium GWE2_29_8]|nr:MAG: transcriptional regulator [Bacteroidetes bacterium GWE2_29_8]OFY16165.1 MAG: transcriptional regulator [Bacteroidetes bacterium GWF2_29_10]
MSGHSKWSTIKRKKGALDAKRSKIFSKIIKEITVSVRAGGADPDGNPALRLAIANAKGANMPKDNLQRAISKGSDKDAANYTEVTYEGYGSAGVAIFVECTTDNLQRTVANVRSYFNKHNGSMGTNGCLNFIFDRKGIFVFPQNALNEDDLTLELIEAGAEDVELDDDGMFTVTTSLEDFGKMQKKLEELKIETESASLQRIPKTFTKLDVETAPKVFKLIDTLEDDDDVQNVYHNIEMTDEIAELMQ